MPTPFGTLTEAESKNGWTQETLNQYLAERDRAADRVAGNVVTQWERPKPAIRIERAFSRNPHNWGRT